MSNTHKLSPRVVAHRAVCRRGAPNLDRGGSVLATREYVAARERGETVPAAGNPGTTLPP